MRQIKGMSTEDMLTEFKKKTKPRSSRVSKLDDYLSLILSLSQDKYSYIQISEFLKLIDVEACPSTIARFVKKKKFEPTTKNSTHGNIVNEQVINKEVVKSVEVDTNPLADLSLPNAKKFSYNPTSVGKKTGSK